MTTTLRRMLHGFIVLAVLCSGIVYSADPSMAEHVVIVGIDGLSPRGIQDARTPSFDRMMQEGAWTIHARAVMPTSSSPNWASMIMGAGPEQHGITSNDWERDKFEIAPSAQGSEGIFPTIFGLVRQRHPDGKIGVFHDWDGFGRLVERQSCDVVVDAEGPLDTTRRAIDFIEQERPKLVFVHLDHVDHAGHTHGWYTPEYTQAVEEADRLLGEILNTLDAVKMAERTIVIVTSDHGGKGKGHGGATMEEIEIPWLIVGPRVRRGCEIAATVNQYDTAATAAFVLGIHTPSCWIARPCVSALTSVDGQ